MATSEEHTRTHEKQCRCSVLCMFFYTERK